MAQTRDLRCDARLCNGVSVQGVSLAHWSWAENLNHRHDSPPFGGLRVFSQPLVAPARLLHQPRSLAWAATGNRDLVLRNRKQTMRARGCDVPLVARPALRSRGNSQWCEGSHREPPPRRVWNTAAVELRFAVSCGQDTLAACLVSLAAEELFWNVQC